jgi:hypothetical protein
MQGNLCVANSFDATIGGETAASGEALLIKVNQQFWDTFGLSDSIFFCDMAGYIVGSNADKTGGQVNCVHGTLPRIQGDWRTKNVETVDFQLVTLSPTACTILFPDILYYNITLNTATCFDPS